MLRCPVCETPVDQATTKSMPFCSERCRLIDLGRWLDEKQGLPIERAEDPDGDRSHGRGSENDYD